MEEEGPNGRNLRRIDRARHDVFAAFQETIHDIPLLPEVRQHEVEGAPDGHDLVVEGPCRRATERHRSGVPGERRVAILLEVLNDAPLDGKEEGTVPSGERDG